MKLFTQSHLQCQEPVCTVMGALLKNTKGCKNVVRALAQAMKLGSLQYHSMAPPSSFLHQMCWHFLPQSAHVVVPPSKDFVQEVVFFLLDEKKSLC